MKIKKIILNFNNVIFYTKEEFDNFSESCKQVSCIKKVEIIENKLMFYIELIKGKNHIPYIFKSDFDLIKDIFKRYKLDCNELLKFKKRDQISLFFNLFYLYSKKDQDIFFKLKACIKGIISFHICGDSLIFTFNYIDISQDDLQNLACIFGRYNLKYDKSSKYSRLKDSEKIYNEILKRTGNTFQPDFLFNGISKFKKKKLSKNLLIIENLTFYSKEDQDIFFEWLKEISCIESIGYKKDALYLYIKYETLEQSFYDGCVISVKDFNDLNLIFKRYKILNAEQLLKFKVKED